MRAFGQALIFTESTLHSLSSFSHQPSYLFSFLCYDLFLRLFFIQYLIYLTVHLFHCTLMLIVNFISVCPPQRLFSTYKNVALYYNSHQRSFNRKGEKLTSMVKNNSFRECVTEERKTEPDYMDNSVS